MGRFRPEKNHIFLIEIFKEIKKKKENAKLLLIGNGDSNEAILRIINNYKLKDDVIIMHNSNEVNKLYQVMDVFVFPSIYEGLGIVTIEAQASGLQVFASDTLPTEVELTENIYKISLEESPQKWAEIILDLYNPNIEKNMQNDASIKGFDISSTAIELQEYYVMLYEKN